MGFTKKIISPSHPFQKAYYPKLQIIGDTLFVCSNEGVYQKDMLQNNDWELYAYESASVIEFVNNGDKLLCNAISANGRDSLLLLSPDNGKAYEDYTSPVFWEYGENHIFRLSQNPRNPNSLLTLASCYGLYRSCDFGKNWQSLHPYGLGIHIAYANFHPLDTTTIFYCGEGAIHSGNIYRSTDNGNTWTGYQVPGGDNCVHQICFHPTDPNLLFFGGELTIGKSTDKGETWKTINLYDTGMYFYKILFDKDNPNILYSSGLHGAYRADNQDTIFVYRSTDTGESWHLAYKEYLGANGGEMIDMVKYKDKLIFYTRELGVLQLDLKTTPVVSLKDVSVKRDLTVYPNPVVGTMHFQTDKIIQRVDVMDSTGKRVQSSLLEGNERSVDVSRLSEGIYLAVFYTGGQRITEKICIARQQ